MDDGQARNPDKTRKDARAERLKQALRENLKRRKTQARERGEGANAPSTDGKPSLHEDGGDDPDV